METSRRRFLVSAALAQAGLAHAAPGAPSETVSPTPAAGALSVRAFGARGDGTTDDYEALTAAVAAAAAQSKELLFPAGIYAHSRPLDLGFPRLRVRGEGLVVLRHTGSSSPCVSIDAGDRAVLYDHVVENIVIEGSGAPKQDGLFVRNMPHGVRRNIRVRNVTGRAFHILGDVLSIWENCIVSGNEGPFEHLPARAFEIDGSPVVSATSAVLFINCMAETATEYGWYLGKCEACRWVGGTSEGLGRHGKPRRPSVGIFVTRGASQNSFDSFFMELNDGGDVVIDGHANRFGDCVMQSRAIASPYESVRSIVVRAGARGNRFEGGSAFSATLERGAQNTTFRHMELGHRIDDQGTGTVIADCLQLFRSGARPPSRTFGNVEDHNPLALDWYQEVDFEPSLRGERGEGKLTYGRRKGVGTRIGNIFCFSIEIEIALVPQAPTGPLLVTGLPFAANSEIGGSASIGEFSGFSLPPSVQVGAQIGRGQGQFRLVLVGVNPSAGGVGAAALKPGAILHLSGQYRV